MDCPRCHLQLTHADYESEQVHFCGTCWGYWLARSQLDKIASAVEYRFADTEKQAVEATFLRDGDANRQGSETQKLPCPACGAEMARKRFAESCPVEIDECDEHGIWLDTGEIKDLQVFIETRIDTFAVCGFSVSGIITLYLYPPETECVADCAG